MIYLVSSKEAWSGRFHHMCRGQLDGVIHWYFGELLVRCASTDLIWIFLIALVLLEKGKAQVLKNAFSCATSYMTIKQQRFFTLYKRIVIWYMQYSIKSTKCRTRRKRNQLNLPDFFMGWFHSKNLPRV